MNNSRESIYAALFSLLQTATGLTTASRRFKTWDQSTGTALYQVQKSEKATSKLPGAKRWELSVDVYLYAVADQSNTAPATALNALLDAIEAALQPEPGVKQTLGGLVDQAYIDGVIQVNTGDIGDVMFAIIPVTIVTGS
ncbi:MAG: hypothetical protein KGL39_31825 [Patescibacteria group bacterium]|nr:hypothetical protein [Patescibacteria group bacterium]